MEKPYVAVAGGVNIDIGGRSCAPLVRGDSNPGVIRSSLGGVGRNIAHNLALLGVRVRFLTALGMDEGAARVERSCEGLGIDLSDALRVENAATSSYLFVADSGGEMDVAVSDMAIYSRLTPDFFEAKLPVLNAASAVVLEANLPEESILYLARHCTAPLFADAVSKAKCPRLRGALPFLSALKPNRMEAEALSGVPIASRADAAAAAGALLQKGVSRVFLTLGSEGIYAADGKSAVSLAPVPGKTVNTTGCGDAAMAAVVCAYMQGADLEQSAKMALAAASVAMESAQTINPRMSMAALCARMNEMEEKV